jgi:hypothetical protein
MALVTPPGWEDPFENLVAMCAITHTGQTPYRQEFFDSTRRPIFAVLDNYERVGRNVADYSTVIKDLETNRSKVPDTEGVRVRTTSRKLLGALTEWSPNQPSEEYCFLGRVFYFSRKN